MENYHKLVMAPVEKISPCPYQCRYTYNIENMETLIKSIKENGIIHPLAVTETEDGYQLISGHRRLFAAKQLKMEKVPVTVLEKSREEIAVLCAAENMHREDLNFFEQAMAIKLLMDQLGLTQTQVGEKLCLTQSAVANKLKLLKLEKNIADMLIKANLTERHARAVCRLPQDKREKAVKHIIRNGLNVAATDRYVDGLMTEKHKGKTVIRIKDVRIFTNTITNALKIMKNAGFAPVFEQNITDKTAEYKIVIPLEKSRQENGVQREECKRVVQI